MRRIQTLLFACLLVATFVISFVQYTGSTHRLRLFLKQAVVVGNGVSTEQPHDAVPDITSTRRPRPLVEQTLSGRGGFSTTHRKHSVPNTTSSHRHGPLSEHPLAGRSGFTTNNPKHSLTGNTNFTAVVLLTYMRSGSSFTGDILQQHPGALYVYEPLRPYERHPAISFLNGTTRDPGTYNTSNFMLETLASWMNCDLYSVYTGSLSDKLFLSFGSKTKQLGSCVTAAAKLHKNASEARIAFIKTCVRKMESVCKASDVRIIKTIRMTMADMVPLMRRMPNLKIINLLRDPRATLQSRRSAGRCPGPMGMIRCPQHYCQRVEEDLMAKKKMKSEFPNRIFTTLYEDVASNPVNTSTKMYDFIGMPYTQSISKYIQTIASSNGDGSLCKVCNANWQNRHTDKQANSTSRIDKWRDIISYEFFNIIQKVCKTAIEENEYEFIDINDLRRS